MSTTPNPITPEQNENGREPAPAPRRSGWEKRIAKLTARNYALEESNSALRTRVAELETQLQAVLQVLDEKRRIIELHTEVVEDECRTLEAQLAQAARAGKGSVI